MQGSESAASLLRESSHIDESRPPHRRSPHTLRISVLLRIVLALLLGFSALMASTVPAAAQDGEPGELVFSCPAGSEIEGEGRNLGCIEITETRIDAITTSNGVLSCRDGSTGSPTAENPTCISEVRNSVRPNITCNGESVVAVGDGDDCALDSDADGLIDGEDFDPFDPSVSEAPAPIQVPTEPPADPETTTPSATEPPAVDGDEDAVTSTIEDDAADTANNAPDDGGSSLVPILVILGLVGAAALTWATLRRRGAGKAPPVSDATPASTTPASTTPASTTPESTTPVSMQEPASPDLTDAPGSSPEPEARLENSDSQERHATPQSGDPKPGGTKSGDTKPGGTKSGDTKPGKTRTGKANPAGTRAGEGNAASRKRAAEDAPDKRSAAEMAAPSDDETGTDGPPQSGNAWDLMTGNKLPLPDETGGAAEGEDTR